MSSFLDAALESLKRRCSSWRRPVGWLAVAVTPAAVLWYIYRYSVNVFVHDEWVLVPFLRAFREGEGWWPWVFRPHNEHRIAALRLPLALIAEWSDWNVVPEMYFGFAIQLLTLVVLWRIVAPEIGRDPLRLAPIAALLFSLYGYQIFLYGMMFVWCILVAATAWALWLLSRQNWGAFAGAVVSGLIASVSINNGLLVWPLGLVLLFIGRDLALRRVLWALSGLAVVMAYYWNYHPHRHPRTLTTALDQPLDIAMFFVSIIGAPYAAGSFWMAFAFGTAMLALLALGWARWLPSWREWTPSERALFGLTAFALISAAAISIARLRLGRDMALEPRYTCLTVFVGIVVYVQFCGRRTGESAGSRTLGGVVAALLVVGYVGNSLYAHEKIVAWRQSRQLHLSILHQIDDLPDRVVASAFHNPAFLRRQVDYLRPRRLGPFSQPPNLLRFTQWGQGVPAGQIIPGRPVKQVFPCPVETLWNLAVPFGTYGRENLGTIELVLSAGGDVLGRREVAAASLQVGEWVLLEIDEPLRSCRGRRLELAVRTDDAAPGSTVTVLTYPPYYEASLFQEDAPNLMGRVVGLELNRDSP